MVSLKCTVLSRCNVSSLRGKKYRYYLPHTKVKYFDSGLDSEVEEKLIIANIIIIKQNINIL